MTKKVWTVAWSDYDVLKQKLRFLPGFSVQLNDIPPSVTNVCWLLNFRTIGLCLDLQDGLRCASSQAFRARAHGKDRQDAPRRGLSFPTAWNNASALKLARHPRQPLLFDWFSFGVQHGGRILLADEMGLGKSVQALGIARYYSNEWPLLIVCPSSVKGAWRQVSCSAASSPKICGLAVPQVSAERGRHLHDRKGLRPHSEGPQYASGCHHELRHTRPEAEGHLQLQLLRDNFCRC